MTVYGNCRVVPDSIVRLRHVTKTFDGHTPVVHDLDLNVARGEFVTLLGPSGSGKTTTLMMLAGFERPDSGQILIEGRPTARTPAHRRGIGIVFQSFALFPHMSVADNIGFPLTMRRIGRAERRERVARALAMVKLTGLDGRRPAQLSGGQQQRVALARALVFEPKLVLLDEPLGALDRALREEMQVELRHLHRQLGVSMVHVTHDQEEALALSDRIAVLRDGRLQQYGTPSAIYETPANAFVARFVGESNRLPGMLEAMVEDDIAAVRLDAGPLVEARLAERCGPGERCIVAIRPERVAVAAAAAGEMGEDVLAARVQEAIYRGDHVRLRLRLLPTGRAPRPGPDIVARRPAGSPLAGLQPGAEAAIAWQPAHAMVFRPEA